MRSPELTWLELSSGQPPSAPLSTCSCVPLTSAHTSRSLLCPGNAHSSSGLSSYAASWESLHGYLLCTQTGLGVPLWHRAPLWLMSCPASTTLERMCSVCVRLEAGTEFLASLNPQHPAQCLAHNGPLHKARLFDLWRRILSLPAWGPPAPYDFGWKLLSDQPPCPHTWTSVLSLIPSLLTNRLDPTSTPLNQIIPLPLSLSSFFWVVCIFFSVPNSFPHKKNFMPFSVFP